MIRRHLSKWSITAQLWAAACLSLSCGGSRAPTPGESVPELAVEGWSISAEPMFSVEEGGSPIPFQLFGALSGVLTEESIVIANGGEGHLLYFDRTGTVLRRAGGRGTGPGEFSTGVIYLNVYDTIIAAFPSVGGPVEFFSSSGNHLGQARLPTDMASMRVLGLLGHDQLALTPTSARVNAGEPRPYQVWLPRDSVFLQVAGPAEPQSGAVRWAAGSPDNSSVPRFANFNFAPRCLPAQIATVLGSTLYVADPSTAEVIALVFSNTNPVRAVHHSAERPIVTDEVLEALNRTLQNLNIPQPTRDEVLGRVGPVGGPLPAMWSEIKSDPLGYLWLREADCSFAIDAPQRWTVIDTLGNVSKRVSVPGTRGLQVLAVRDPLLLLTRLGDYNVPRVELYSVVRTQ